MVRSALRPTLQTTGVCMLADVEAEERADPEGRRYLMIAGALDALREIGMTDAEIEQRYGITLKPEHRTPILPA